MGSLDLREKYSDTGRLLWFDIFLHETGNGNVHVQRQTQHLNILTPYEAFKGDMICTDSGWRDITLDNM